MRIFALETNIHKLNKSLISPGEDIVLMVRFHGLQFTIRAIAAVILTFVLIAVGIGANIANIPGVIVAPILAIAWFVIVLRPLLRAWIDWRYDELLITTDKIVIVNQTSIIRQEIQQMSLDNLASVSVLTQYGGLLPFGKLHFELKEGMGEGVRLRFIPEAKRVCSVIGTCMVNRQRDR